MSFINGDGGHLPPGAPESVPPNLFNGYGSRPAAERAAFRQAVCPRHHQVNAPEDVYLSLPQATAGDIATVNGSNAYLFLLKSNAPGSSVSWINMFTNQPPPEA